MSDFETDAERIAEYMIKINGSKTFNYSSKVLDRAKEILREGFG